MKGVALMASLNETRLRNLMTIRELAAAAEVSTKTIVDIEAGRTMPRPGTMRRIAAALGVEPVAIDEFAAAIDAAIEEGKDAA
jgi:transcriptional regulator with XRE-family HTH domain